MCRELFLHFLVGNRIFHRCLSNRAFLAVIMDNKLRSGKFNLSTRHKQEVAQFTDMVVV